MSIDPWVPEPVSPVEPDAPVAPEGGTGTGAGVLESVRAWLDRFVCVVDEADLDILTLWAAHTHLVMETYTSPRLTLDSPVPGSGKTTVLEHLERLCVHPVQMASVSSSALLARMLDEGIRTLLIDEVDRTLDPKKELTSELLAVLNSGYKRGGSRPVLVPSKGGEWRVSEMPTYSPVAMAGNNPNLPDDTKSRAIRVLLMPDIDGTAEETDWEWISEEADDLALSLSSWADLVRDEVRRTRPTLPDEVRGRARERWAPLKRVAAAAGGHWPSAVDEMASADVKRLAQEKEEGIVSQRPHIVLLAHIREVWPEGESFVSTESLIDLLVESHPETWGEFSTFGKRLTAQRLGKMMTVHYGIHTDRIDRGGPRGYVAVKLSQTLHRFGHDPLQVTGASGPSGETGAAQCAHGMTGGTEPDPFLDGRVTCPECAREAVA